MVIKHLLDDQLDIKRILVDLINFTIAKVKA